MAEFGKELSLKQRLELFRKLVEGLNNCCMYIKPHLRTDENLFLQTIAKANQQAQNNLLEMKPVASTNTAVNEASKPN